MAGKSLFTLPLPRPPESLSADGSGRRYRYLHYKDGTLGGLPRYSHTPLGARSHANLLSDPSSGLPRYYYTPEVSPSFVSCLPRRVNCYFYSH